MKKRIKNVIAYIDGFNLYYGLRDRYQRRYLWLDLERLCRSFLRANQQLTQVKYFTASIRKRPGSLSRQHTYWNALEAYSSHLTIFPGRFQERTETCRGCGSIRTSYEEKETDVAIAVAMLEDAAVHAFDTALLLSADSDLYPAIQAVRRLHPSGRVVAAFPPARNSDRLRRSADAVVTIGRRKLAASQLPEQVSTPNGKSFSRPPSWK